MFGMACMYADMNNVWAAFGLLFARFFYFCFFVTFSILSLRISGHRITGFDRARSRTTDVCNHTKRICELNFKAAKKKHISFVQRFLFCGFIGFYNEQMQEINNRNSIASLFSFLYFLYTWFSVFSFLSIFDDFHDYYFISTYLSS